MKHIYWIDVIKIDPKILFEDNLMIDVISHVSPLNAHCIKVLKDAYRNSGAVFKSTSQ